MTGSELKAARTALGLSVKEMARALRLSEASGEDTIRKWERDKTPISGPASVAVEAMLEGFIPKPSA